jgi:RNA polymerase sigma factor (TIGR02999 family)
MPMESIAHHRKSGAKPDNGSKTALHRRGALGYVRPHEYLESGVESRVVALFSAAEAGGASASAELFAALYGELHRLADRELQRMGPQLALGTTTLLHEAYLDLAAREGVRFPDRARFMAYAARAMRGLVIDYVRRSRAQKRGGGAFEITLTDIVEYTPAVRADADELQRLSNGLDELSQLEPPLAQLVDLHFFCGYTFAEIAAMRGVSERTVQRDWRKARILLHHSLVGVDAGDVGGSR